MKHYVNKQHLQWTDNLIVLIRPHFFNTLSKQKKECKYKRLEQKYFKFNTRMCEKERYCETICFHQQIEKKSR